MGDARTELPASQGKMENVVTRNIIANILRDYDPKLTLRDFKVKLGTAAGDNYASVMYSVEIRTVQGKQLRIMLKTLPTVEFRQKMLNDIGAFEKEIKMYSDVFVEFEEFQRERGLTDNEIFSGYPKCYSTFFDGKADFLALEDLRDYDFKMVNRKTGQNKEHSKLTLESIAKFHAISYAKYGGDFDTLRERFPYLEEKWMKPKEETQEMFISMAEGSNKKYCEVLKDAGFEEESEQLKTIMDDDYFDKMYYMAGREAPVNVINHGDCWNNNMMFQYAPDGVTPINQKFLDFQIARCGSRCLDIGYFMNTSVPTELLVENEDELLKWYLDEFTRFCGKLGVKIEGDKAFDWDSFKKEMNDYRFFGVVMGIMLTTAMQADKENVPDMDGLDEDVFANEEKLQKIFGDMLCYKAVERIAALVKHQLPKCSTWVRPHEEITKEMVKTILKNYNPALQLGSWKKSKGSEVGDNYASIMFQVDIEATNKEKLSVMVKTMPSSPFRQKMLNEIKAFDKEGLMYNVIFPEFEKFQESKGIQQDSYPYPKCYGIHLDGSTDWLAMENLKPHGYQMANRMLGLDFEHASIVMKNLGKMHSISYAIYRGDYVTVLDKLPELKDFWMKPAHEVPEDMRNFTVNNFNKFKKSLEDAGFTKDAEGFDLINDSDYLDKMYSLVSPAENEKLGVHSINVIALGDCWCNNFLFKYGEDGKTPTELKFLDFQLAKFCSRLIDIVYFLHTSVQSVVLDSREDELLKIYLDEFTCYGKKLGVPSDDPAFSWTKFKEEMGDFRFFGIVMGVMIASLIFAPKDKVVSLDDIKNDSIEEFEKADFFGKSMTDKSTERIANLLRNQLPKCSPWKGLKK